MIHITPWIAALVGLLFTCVADAVEPYRVGVLYWSMNIPGQVAMRRGLEAEAERINAAAGADAGADAGESGRRPVELIPRVAGDGEAGIERQVRQMEELVARGVDLIVVQPADNAALAHPLRAANRAGIPVVAYDQYISGGELVSYVTSDNEQAGRLGGEYTAATLPDDGEPLRVVLVEYPHVSSTVERVNGFLDALTAAGRAFRVVGTYAAVEPVAGREAGRAIVEEFPAGSVDVLFTVNDGGGLAVVDELAAAGRDELFVVTIDGDPQSVANIREGRLTRFDAAQFCGPLGAEALRIGYRQLNGEAVPRQALMPVFPITRETLDRYPGWQGPIPTPFDKPWASDQPRWSGVIKAMD
ncbi:sugar ABC transporter substrate-binding protein [Endothiovibrio diazotrophicus]